MSEVARRLLTALRLGEGFQLVAVSASTSVARDAVQALLGAEEDLELRVLTGRELRERDRESAANEPLRDALIDAPA